VDIGQMSVDEVKARVEEIRNRLPDNEVAHILEDRLYKDILECVAAGQDMPEQARIALQVKGIHFARWYA